MIEEFPKILLVDMNSFFPSVEQQANPFFRGKPVGVCASTHKTSCLIAASKEAKQLGIRTGTLIYQAKRICPEIVLLTAEPEKYREVNRRINRIFGDYSDLVESYSIDEAFIDLRHTNLNPLVVGAEIKRRIKAEAGDWLTCSIGIGANKFLAKLASDLEKPDGLTVVWRSQLPVIYRNKKLSDLWGVSRGWEKRLNKIGITNPVQVLNYPVQNLISLFGKPGYYLWRRLNGLEEDEIMTREERPKSFGNSWVLNFRTTDKEKLRPVILRLAEKAARRMRNKKLKAKGLFVLFDYTDGTSFYRTKKLKFYIETGIELYEQVISEWGSAELNKEVRKIAVGFMDLNFNSKQLSLFEENKYFKLTDELDKINDKFGEFTIRSALLTDSSDYAPDAIAFGK